MNSTVALLPAIAALGAAATVHAAGSGEHKT